MRNPPWTIDELILALDLYFRVDPLHTSESNPAIAALSELLNKLPIHLDRPDASRFRNPNGVYMKMCNFLRLDPAYQGSGLKAGSHLDEVVWNEYANDRSKLARVAAAIRECSTSTTDEAVQLRVTSDEEEIEASEGKVLTRLHRSRERNRDLVNRKKDQVSKSGRFACEICEFDFVKRYGSIGEGFLECHHKRPLSTLVAGEKTKLADLALVCSNCHRMLHRGNPWPTVEELRDTVQSTWFRHSREFEAALETLSSGDPSMLKSRLLRGATDQLGFLQLCKDREPLERFYLTMARYGHWSETIAEEIERVLRTETLSEAGKENLQTLHSSSQCFAGIQKRFSFREFSS